MISFWSFCLELNYLTSKTSCWYSRERLNHIFVRYKSTRPTTYIYSLRCSAVLVFQLPPLWYDCFVGTKWAYNGCIIFFKNPTKVCWGVREHHTVFLPAYILIIYWCMYSLSWNIKVMLKENTRANYKAFLLWSTSFFLLTKWETFVKWNLLHPVLLGSFSRVMLF